MRLLAVRACLSLALACHVVALTPLDPQVSGMSARNRTNTTNTTTTTAKRDFNKVHDNSVGYLVFSVVLNGSILVIGLVAFQIGLCLDETSCFLAPRWNDPQGNVAGEKKWAWKEVFRVIPRMSGYDDNLVKQMSLDGIMLVRFCFLGFKFCGFGSIVSIFLIPLYATGSAGAKGFQVYSLSNVDVGSKRFWCAIVSAYAMLALFAKLVLNEWLTFRKLRQAHLYQRATGLLGNQAAHAERSLRVEFYASAVAGPLNKDTIKEFFEKKLFGSGSVKFCVFHRGMLSDAVGIVARCTTRAILFGRRVRRRLLTNNNTDTPSLTPPDENGDAAFTAYVTLSKVQDRVVALQVPLCDDQRSHGRWRIYPAVDAREIIWSHVADPENIQGTLTAIFLVVRVVGYLSWSVLVIGVQAWANLDSWTSPAVRKMAKASPFICSYLPVVALMLLLLAVPYVLEFISTQWERVKTESQMAKDVIRRNFGFQLVSLYVIVASTSLFSSMKEILKEPDSALMQLRDHIPASANYFINFVLARTGVTLSFYLLRPWDWPTWTKNVRCMFGTEAVYQALVFTLGLTYSFVAPAMLPVCALYFGLASLVYTWLFKYVYEETFDVAGGFWYDLFEGSMFGLFLGTLTLTGVAFAYADIKWELTLACAPLPIAVVCLYRYCLETHMKPSLYLTLDQARLADDPSLPAVEYHEETYNPSAEQREA